jgi:hypothetical protein
MVSDTLCVRDTLYVAVDNDNSSTSVLALNVNNFEEETKLDIGNNWLFSSCLAEDRYMLIGADYSKLIIVDTLTNKKISEVLVT